MQSFVPLFILFPLLFSNSRALQYQASDPEESSVPAASLYNTSSCDWRDEDTCISSYPYQAVPCNETYTDTGWPTCQVPYFNESIFMQVSSFRAILLWEYTKSLCRPCKTIVACFKNHSKHVLMIMPLEGRLQKFGLYASVGCKGFRCLGYQVGIADSDRFADFYRCNETDENDLYGSDKSGNVQFSMDARNFVNVDTVPISNDTCSYPSFIKVRSCLHLYAHGIDKYRCSISPVIES